MRRFLIISMSLMLKMSITGDTAKYLGFTLSRVGALSPQDSMSWEWPRQMLQSIVNSRTRGKGGQPSAVRDEGGDTRVYPGSPPPEGKDLLLLDCIDERVVG